MNHITPQRLREFTAVLQKYKSGKASLERRVISAENWWKLRNRFEESKTGLKDDGGFRSVSGWLHNVIVSKHADAMEAYPEPLILPRESGDREQAELLSAIIPCILEQNRFEKTYDHAMWQKLKTGTAVYRAVWDAGRCGGLGDVAIERMDLLNLFWEPGLSDIQKSPYFFCTHPTPTLSPSGAPPDPASSPPPPAAKPVTGVRKATNAYGNLWYQLDTGEWIVSSYVTLV